MKHPDYPDIDFKTSLAYHNYEQTYDLIHIPQSLYVRTLGVQDNELGYREFIDDCLSGVPIKFDRYFPQKGLFATDYSGKCYHALKKYGSGIRYQFLDLFLSGALAVSPTNSSGRIPHPDFRALIDYQTKSLRDNFKRRYALNYSVNGEDLVLVLPSFPPRDYTVYYSVAVYQGYNSTVNYITCKIPPSLTPKDIAILTHYPIVPCTGRLYKQDYSEITEYDGYMNDVSEALLYSNADEFFDLLVEELDYMFPAFNKGLQYSMQLTDIAKFNWQENFGQVQLLNFQWFTTVTIMDATLIDLPDWYKKSIFRVANNNIWGLSGQDTVYSDEGEDYYFLLDNGNITAIFNKLEYTPLNTTDSGTIYVSVEDDSPLGYKGSYQWKIYNNSWLYWQKPIQYTNLTLENKELISDFFNDYSIDEVVITPVTYYDAFNNPYTAYQATIPYTTIEARESIPDWTPSLSVVTTITDQTYYDNEPVVFLDTTKVYLSESEIITYLKNQYDTIEGYV